MFRLKIKRLGSRASASVELALTSVFFLLPLVGGSSDLLQMVSAQAEVNTSLRALYSFAWTDPGYAGNNPDLKTVISAINTSAFHPVSFPTNLSKADPAGGTQNGGVYYVCIPNTGSTFSQTSPCPIPPTGSTLTYIQQKWVSYQVNSSVYLPVPLPIIETNPLTLSASGTVQVQ